MHNTAAAYLRPVKHFPVTPLMHPAGLGGDTNNAKRKGKYGQRDFVMSSTGCHGTMLQCKRSFKT